MIRKIAWETFKNTGNVNTFLELKQFEGAEENIQNQKLIENNIKQIQKVEQYGDNKNEWNNNSGEQFRRL